MHICIFAYLFILLIAFGLRVYRLDYQSVWHDEGYSIYQAQHLFDPSPEARRVFDTDRVPPFHPLILRGWLTLTGTSEFALRYFSLICGMLTVVLSYRFATRLADDTIGIVTAIIAAFSPFYLYYSQEVRSYALLLFWTLLAAYTFTKLFRAEYSHWWLVYPLVEAFSIYTHFTSIALVAAKNLFVVLYLIMHRPPRRAAFVKRWVIAQIALGLLFLPVYIITPTKELFRESGNVFTYAKLHNVLQETLSTFNGTPNSALMIGGVILLSVGLFLPVTIRRRIFPARLYLITYLLIPIIAAVVYLQKPGQFAGKFLIAISPAYYILIAWGIASLARRFNQAGTLVAISAALLIFSGNLTTLQNYYYHPSRSNFRGAINYINDRARPNDVVVLCAPYFYPTFSYYNKTDLEWRGLPRAIPMDEEATATELQEIIASYDRIWLLLWQSYYPDPDGFIVRWLYTHAHDKIKEKFTDVTLLNFVTDRFIYTHIPDIQYPQSANLGNQARFLGYDLDRAETMPGENVEITLYWEALAPMETNYTVFTHLIDSENRVWGGRDGWPVDGGYPTTRWRPGEIIRDAYAIPVATDAPPGGYQVEIGMYDLETMQRLPILDDAGNPVDTRVAIGVIEVEGRGEK